MCSPCSSPAPTTRRPELAPKPAARLAPRPQILHSGGESPFGTPRPSSWIRSEPRTCDQCGTTNASVAVTIVDDHGRNLVLDGAYSSPRTSLGTTLASNVNPEPSTINHNHEAPPPILFNAIPSATAARPTSPKK